MGVYVTVLNAEGRRRQGVTNIGVRPTINSHGAAGPMTVETHILDFEQDLYGKQVTLEFLARLREERRFQDKDALVAQIRRDVVRARRYFAKLKALAPAFATYPFSH
jgi:riboflavin kinase/FMN adenylyltransferase